MLKTLGRFRGPITRFGLDKNQRKKSFIRLSLAGVNFTKIYRAAFSFVSFWVAFLYLHRFELLLAHEYWRKSAHKMLVKLASGCHDFKDFLAFQPRPRSKRIPA